MKKFARFNPNNGFYEEIWSDMKYIKGWKRIK